MALAGADRIFTLLDEEPERDEGYVTLVNASYRNDTVMESSIPTGKWAWKHTHKADGTTDYVEVKGNVVLKEGVDYSISYANISKAASKTDAKAPTVTVNFKGKYKGKQTLKYDITKQLYEETAFENYRIRLAKELVQGE